MCIEGVYMIKVVLKDGTVLKCNIYENDKAGEHPILNHERINNLFSRLDENIIPFKEALINFQTEMINGKFHPANVESYEIYSKQEQNGD
jgi:predicted acyl esterase